ncbi:MAG: hypothetical protein WCP95_11100 [Actinomycetes bacterium]
MPDAPVQLLVEDGRLRIDSPTGFDRASLLGSIDIPVEHVTDVEVVERPGDAITGWREGIGLPHLRMGTWHHDGAKDYVAVNTQVPGVVVTLREEEFARLVVSAADPSGLARQIISARDAAAGG